jgi:hypothetical protein
MQKFRLRLKTLGYLVMIFQCLGSSSLAGQDAARVLLDNLAVQPPLTSIPAKSLLKSHFDYACVLPPYANELHSGLAVDKVVNSALKARSYHGSEDRWAIILVKGETIELLNMQRSAQLDFLSLSDTAVASALGPFKAKRANCSAYESATFYLISIKDRHYVVLGEQL